MIGHENKVRRSSIEEGYIRAEAQGFHPHIILKEGTNEHQRRLIISNDHIITMLEIILRGGG